VPATPPRTAIGVSNAPTASVVRRTRRDLQWSDHTN
jgi:hypothetical protein